MIQIYHNSRCSKSRACLAFIEATGQEYEVVKYLETNPSFEVLQSIIKKLGIPPIALVRQKENIWVENYKNKDLSDDEIIQSMSANPILIERPIVINGNHAVIARPLDKLQDLI